MKVTCDTAVVVIACGGYGSGGSGILLSWC